LAEGQSGTGMLGDTFNHILIDQFTRSMVGYRFFYLGDADILSILDPDFTATTTLAGIIRRNSSIREIQDNAFLVVPEPSSLALCIIVLLLTTLRNTSGPRIRRFSRAARRRFCRVHRPGRRSLRVALPAARTIR